MIRMALHHSSHSHRQRSAQIFFEFLIMLVVMLFIGMVYLATTRQLFIDVSEEQRATALSDVGYTIQDELIAAMGVEDGYHRVFTVPEKADRFSYTLTSDATSVSLTSGSMTMTFDLPVYVGNISKGMNAITKDGALTVVPG